MIAAEADNLIDEGEQTPVIAINELERQLDKKSLQYCRLSHRRLPLVIQMTAIEADNLIDERGQTPVIAINELKRQLDKKVCNIADFLNIVENIW